MLADGDAIGGHVLWIRDHLRSRGCDSEIFVGEENSATSHESLSLQEANHRIRSPIDDTLLIYHVAQASTCADFLASRQEPLALIFHNFTPPELLIRWDPDAAFEILNAKDQLTELVGKSLFAICDSEFNSRVLDGFGKVKSFVIPLPLREIERSDSSPEEPPIVLFVGRIAPNKGIHDLVACMAVLRENLPDVRLRVVGTSTSDAYDAVLEKLTTSLDLTGVVTLTGWVNSDELEREYQRASVFCTLSDHEGFGVPILEAMAYGIPVVAYDNSAIGDTVGDSGLLLNSKEPTVVASALDRVLSDKSLSDRLCRSGRQRSKLFSGERVAEALDRALSWSSTS